MKPLTIFLMLALFSFHSFSQTREIYVNPNFTELAKDHKKVAIIPFKIIMKLRPKQTEQMTPEQLAQLQKDEGMAVQSAIHTYFLKRKAQDDFRFNFWIWAPQTRS